MPSSEDCATLQAYADGVDAAAREAEAKWGQDRLPLIVSDDLRAKFYRQRDKWLAALSEAWETERLTRDQLDGVIGKAAAMRRAWAALDAAAEEAGHRAIFPDVWECTLDDGSIAAFVRTNAEASKVLADGRHVHVYTLAEVGHVIDALPSSLRQVHAAFPGAEVIKPKGAPAKSFAPDQDIPF